MSQGRIFGSSTNGQLAESCRWNESVREARRAAREITEDTTGYRVHVIARDAVYELLSLRETIRWNDGGTTVRPMVLTRIWSRGPDGWIRAHVHESWQEGGGG